MDHAAESSEQPGGESIEPKQEQLDRLKQEVDSLQVHVLRASQPWYRNVSVLISVCALLFSFTTSLLSERRVNEQSIHDARVELRSLIQRLVAIPRENTENWIRLKDDPGAAGSLSGMIMLENTMLAKQAAEVVDRIPTRVTATELSAVASALAFSSLPDKSRKYYDLAFVACHDANDEVGVLRNYGQLLFSLGDVAGGREKYRVASTVFDRYPTTNAYFVNTTDFLTEYYWAQMEYSQRQFGEVKPHLEKAHRLLDNLPTGPYTDSLTRQLQMFENQVKIGVPLPKPPIPETGTLGTEIAPRPN